MGYMDRMRRKGLLTATLITAMAMVTAACSTLSTNSQPSATAGQSAAPSANASGLASGDVGASASPSAGASPSADSSWRPILPPGSSPGTVASAAQAAALVLSGDPRFAQVSALVSGLVGASAWYEVAQTVDGFSVTVTLGSGDCQAGCINQHNWHYSVSLDGKVTLTGQDGDAVEYSPPAPAAGPATLLLTAQAGPTCPVERNPPDPSCAPRAVAGAAIVIYSPAGDVIAQGQTDANGQLSLQLPGGAYWVATAAVEGLMGTPDAQAFSVVAGNSAHVLFEYDTGIR